MPSKLKAKNRVKRASCPRSIILLTMPSIPANTVLGGLLENWQCSVTVKIRFLYAYTEVRFIWRIGFLAECAKRATLKNENSG